MVETPKIVFTKTLEQSHWERTELATGDLTEEIRNLKNKNGKDIIVYGGGSFVSSLIDAKLIDEFYLFVNPCAIGSGMTIFKGLAERQNMKLLQSQAFECGVVVLNYEQKKA